MTRAERYITDIKFEDKYWKVEKFNYFSGRMGLILTDVTDEKTYFSGTLDIDNVKIYDNEIIVKSHDFNKGLLEVLLKEKIIEKQYRETTLGFNKVYICTLWLD